VLPYPRSLIDKFIYLLGSPWGAGTFAGPDGSRQPTALELEIANIQGKEFYNVVKKSFPNA
jgi:multimeric flavodoxin WrbA